MSITEKQVTTVTPFSAQLALSGACQAYLERRNPNLKPRSVEAYQYHFRTLQRYFDPQQELGVFHEGHFRDYQKWRLAAGAGASLVNHELGALAQLLELAGLWHPISKYYEHLPERNWSPPKVMTPEEEDRFLRFAKCKPEWKTALNSALLTGNTTIAGNCLRTLKLESIRLEQDPPVILVPATAKNCNRVRGVPLNRVAYAAVRELFVQAKERGSSEPQHYLIPFRVKKGLFDPSRPASPCFIRAAFRSIRRAAGLNWVTPTTFRHQAITKLLESGAPDETVRAIAGHGTEKAMKYYSHIRIHAKKDAVDRLESIPQKPRVTRMAGARETFPVLNGLRETAKRLGVREDAALELVLSFEQQDSGKVEDLMEQQTKDYVKSLLSIIKSLYAENYALRAMNQASPISEIRETWEQTLNEILEMPETQKEIDDRFDPQIDTIVQLLDDQEAVAALLEMPTKGLTS